MKKILLVDNIRSILEREKGLLDRDIFQIFTATSGEEALDVHKKEKADIIIMCLHMTGMGGDEVCKAIRRDPELKHVSDYPVDVAERREGDPALQALAEPTII